MQLGISLTLLIGTNIPTPASADIMNAIQSVQVTNTDEGRQGFQIVFSIGRNSVADVSDNKLMKNSLLMPFSRITISVTIGVTQKILIDGIITHHQYNPSNEPGKSTLTITGEDVSVMMDMIQKSCTYPNQSPTTIVENIISKYNQYKIIPDIVSNIATSNTPSSNKKIPSQQETDLQYILKLSKIYDYIFYVEPSSVGSNTAYWIPADDARTRPPQGQISVNMGPNTNVNSLNFQYNSLGLNKVEAGIHDSDTNKNMKVNVDTSSRDPLSAKPSDSNQSNIRVKQLRNTGGLNYSEVQKIAQAEVDKSSDVVTGSGEIDTSSYGDVLRARGTVLLRGAGASYDGRYYVKSVTHDIKPGEYKQTFNITREGFGSGGLA